MLMGEAFSQLSPGRVKQFSVASRNLLPGGNGYGASLGFSGVGGSDAMQQLHHGGCHCGALRYAFSGPLQDIAHCHCSVCRRVSGGLVTTWITVPREAFSWVKGPPVRYDSSSTCQRFFCGHCGAHLALATRLSPESIDVTIATLDHPELAPADRHIWADSRLPWLHLDEHLPQEPEETL